VKIFSFLSFFLGYDTVRETRVTRAGRIDRGLALPLPPFSLSPSLSGPGKGTLCLSDLVVQATGDSEQRAFFSPFFFFFRSCSQALFVSLGSVGS